MWKNEYLKEEGQKFVLEETLLSTVKIWSRTTLQHFLCVLHVICSRIVFTKFGDKLGYMES